MNLVRFEPWSVVDLVQRDLDRIAARRFAPGNDNHPLADWIPPVDIIENKDCFVVRADVPGVDPADIEVNMDNGVLSVSGERQSESSSDVDGVQRVERASGRFCRRFTLPDTADADAITARTNNGILEIAIQKLPEVKARRITVEAA